jgi:lipoic acid synthetase
MREPGTKHKGEGKTAPLKFMRREALPKPAWIRVRAPGAGSRFHAVKRILREQRLHTVCEEASCPNIGECFGHGTATFMILGDLCTRRCPFCDVAHGRPLAPDAEEPRHLAETVARLGLRHVVVTSVDRDDLRDGGAAHFVECISAIREASPKTTIEILVPDFRGRLERALEILRSNPPDVMNHNLETVPRLYRRARPGGDYAHSLKLLFSFGRFFPEIPTKSGLMLGLGETDEEILEVMRDLRANGVAMLTIGQYLAPSAHHLPVERYAPPEVFSRLEGEARAMGFRHAAIGPLVRSSYHADRQAHEAGVHGTPGG